MRNKRGPRKVSFREAKLNEGVTQWRWEDPREAGKLRMKKRVSGMGWGGVLIKKLPPFAI